MKQVHVFVLAGLMIGSCSKPDELFTVRITVNDSVMTYSDGRVIENVPDLLVSSSYFIPSLSDTLDRIRSAIADSEMYANVRYPGRLVVNMQTEGTYHLLVRMLFTALVNQCGELRIIRQLTDGRLTELPFVVYQSRGMYHYIEVHPDGLVLGTAQQILFSSPAYEAFDAQRIPYSLELKEEKSVDVAPKRNLTKERAAARAERKRASMPKRNMARLVGHTSLGRQPLFIPNRNGKTDLKELRRILDWITAEFEKLDIHEGRHFGIAAFSETPSSEVFDIAQVIIESFSRDVGIQKAALWDIAPPPIPAVGDGKFRYYTGWSARFDEFSIGLTGLLRDARSGPIHTDSTAYKQLLSVGSLMYQAIQDSLSGRIDKLLEYGVDINGYAFEVMHIYAKHYSIKDEPELNKEHWQDWHGYTPLLLAISENKSEIVRQLISRGADVNKASKRYSYTVETFAIIQEGSHKDIPVHTQGRVITPLRLAKEKGYDAIVKILVDAGAK